MKQALLYDFAISCILIGSCAAKMLNWPTVRIRTGLPDIDFQNIFKIYKIT